MKKIDSLNQANEGNFILSINNFNENYLLHATNELEALQELADYVRACLLANLRTDILVRRFDSPLRLPIIANLEIK